MNKIIWFRTDRLGDFLIHSHLIRDASIKIPNSYNVVVCSTYNEKIIKEYNFIDETIAYDKKFSFFKKIKTIWKIIASRYYLSVVMDGKKVSYLCVILMKSKIKIGLIYKVKKNFLGIIKYDRFRPFRFKFISEKLIFDHIKVMTSRKSLEKSEHLPTLYTKLLNPMNLNTKSTDPYLFPVKSSSDQYIKKLLKKLNINEYAIIHFDEKWIDVKNFTNEAVDFLKKMQEKIDKSLIITSFKNDFDYMNNIRSQISTFNYNKQSINNINCSEDRIIHLEDFPIFEFERLINYSNFILSCHAGFVVQVCGTNSTHIVDLLNDYDCTWYDCWVPYNTNYSRIYKSKLRKKISIDDITKQIMSI